MNNDTHRSATHFRQLHANGLLILVNTADAGSARLFESLGARAIATSSAAVAWSHGYPDGEAIPLPTVVATVAEIVRVVRVPVSVDFESGYSNDPARVAENVALLIDAGAVGINLEDGPGDPDQLCRKIEAVKNTGARLGVDVFVNARTDVYLRRLVSQDHLLRETVARGERYRTAGADGFFVPGLTARADLRAVADGVPLPLNVFARPGLPPVSELSALGVRRLSAGGAIGENVFAQMAALAREFLRTGDSGPLLANAMPYPEINALMTRR